MTKRITNRIIEKISFTISRSCDFIIEERATDCATDRCRNREILRALLTAGGSECNRYRRDERLTAGEEDVRRSRHRAVVLTTQHVTHDLILALTLDEPCWRRCRPLAVDIWYRLLWNDNTGQSVHRNRQSIAEQIRCRWTKM